MDGEMSGSDRSFIGGDTCGVKGGVLLACCVANGSPTQPESPLSLHTENPRKVVIMSHSMPPVPLCFTAMFPPLRHQPRIFLGQADENVFGQSNLLLGGHRP